MALPSSGTISLGMVINEFGGGDNLRDFFRGGAYVPDTPTNSGVPTSGTIRLRHLLGASDTTSNPLALTLSPAHSYAEDAVSPFSTVSYCQAVVSGGSGTKSYSWTKLSGDTFTVSGASSANVSFSRSGSTPGEYKATYRCTVSDSTGSVSKEVDVLHRWGQL